MENEYIYLDKPVDPYHHIRVSQKAYDRLKALSKKSEYKGRGIVGVVDKILFDKFTTIGQGKYQGNKKGGKKDER